MENHPLKYFLITCKHGHVGRDKYIPISIPIKAMSVEAALRIARLKGGVKRDHPDWCLGKPIEIDEATFIEEKHRYQNDPYFKNKTRQNLHLFEERLVKEKNYTYKNKVKTNTKTFVKEKNKEFKILKARTLKKLSKIKDSFDEDEIS